MDFQWLAMRIQEERDRREREAGIRERLPRVLAELFESLKACVDAYKKAFGADAAEIVSNGNRIQITAREDRGATWQPRAVILVDAVLGLPGFRVDAGGDVIEIQVGLLPGDRVYYKYSDQYLTMEQLTKLILDRALFPKLVE
jgi:hypothetical protein